MWWSVLEFSLYTGIHSFFVSRCRESYYYDFSAIVTIKIGIGSRLRINPGVRRYNTSVVPVPANVNVQNTCLCAGLQQTSVDRSRRTPIHAGDIPMIYSVMPSLSTTNARTTWAVHPYPRVVATSQPCLAVASSEVAVTCWKRVR